MPVIVTVQLVVAVLAIVVRFLVPGYLLMAIVLTLGALALIALAPMIVATLAGLFVVWRGNWSLRIVAAGVIALMDLALLTSALTIPDVVDDYDTTEVPITNLIHGRHELSKKAVAMFETISERSVQCYLVAAALTVCLAVAVWWRAQHWQLINRTGRSTGR